MFVNQTHMPQLLRNDQYASAEQFQREKETLFRSAWHFVGLKSEFREHRFRTLSILNHPLIVWQCEGEYHTFLNVCAHRFSMLTDKPCGHAEHLKCQYHGWEYNATGDTQRIPDAHCFRPLSREMAHLKKYRTATVGDLIFMNFDDEAPNLEESLGPGYARCEQWFSPAWRLTLATEQHLAGDWKLLIENTIENYHISEVHSKTFSNLPEEKICHHELNPDWTLYREEAPSADSFLGRWGLRLFRMLKIDPPPGIEVFHCFPHQVFVRMGLHTWVQAAIPQDHRSCSNHWRFFHYRGTDSNLTAALVAQILRRWGRRFFRRVLDEDAAILPAVHRGLVAPDAPVGGLISTREERIFQFQEYVRKKTNEICGDASSGKHNCS